MQIQFEKTDNVLVVKPIERRVDASSAVEFRGSLVQAVQESDGNVVLDVGAVEFIDSTGLSAIISALKVMHKDGKLAVSEACETIETLFKLTRMDKVFQLFPTTAEAIEALKVESSDRAASHSPE